MFQLERLLGERCQSASLLFVLVFVLSFFFFLLFFLPSYKAVKIHHIVTLYKFAVQIYFAN